MSAPTRMSALSVCTLWKKGAEDDYGRFTFESPVLISVCFDVNLSQKYSNLGIENIPNSVAWMEVGEVNPSKGDHIIKGDYSSDLKPVDGAEIITDTELNDCSLLGDVDDIKIMT